MTLENSNDIAPAMTVAEIQKRMDAMPAAMSAKGLRLPDADMWITANRELRCFIEWNTDSGGSIRDAERKSFYGSSPDELLAQAETFISGLPSADETKRNTFLSALAKVIDLGGELGQDVGALAAEMKRLASNAITDQRSSIQPAE